MIRNYQDHAPATEDPSGEFLYVRAICVGCKNRMDQRTTEDVDAGNSVKAPCPACQRVTFQNVLTVLGNAAAYRAARETDEKDHEATADSAVSASG